MYTRKKTGDKYEKEEKGNRYEKGGKQLLTPHLV